MDGVQELQSEFVPERSDSATRIQSGVYLLELSLDWIVLRASENIHHLLRESHVTLIDEPIGRFVHAQALHDLRNLFSRLGGTTGVARAYRVRLTDEPDLVDIAFQLRAGRVVLEAVSSAGGFGESFGSVGGLVSGLATARGQALLDSAARRMRALTGYDRIVLICGAQRAESSRGAFASSVHVEASLPPVIADVEAPPVAIFPREDEDRAVDAALMGAPGRDALQSLAEAGVRATMRTSFDVDGLKGEFRCDSRTPREPNLELHAAAELFAQLFAMRLEIDRLKKAD